MLSQGFRVHRRALPLHAVQPVSLPFHMLDTQLLDTAPCHALECVNADTAESWRQTLLCRYMLQRTTWGHQRQIAVRSTALLNAVMPRFRYLLGIRALLPNEREPQ